ncbi:MAG: hypothetical protein ACM3ZB_02125 [bacterium]
MARSNSGALLSAAGATEVTRSLREVLSDAASAVAVRQAGADATGSLGAEIAQLRATSLQQAEATALNTQALLENTVARATGATSVAGGIGKWMLGIATGGVAPLISGLVKLFSGGGEKEPEPLVLYTAPNAISYEGEVTGARGVIWRTAGEAEPIAAPRTQPMQVTVQVQAMDSRSFLDHRDDIARAVRQAMLNSHSLNDVMGEMG